MSDIKISDLEKILSFIPIKNATAYFSVDKDSGFDYSPINQMAGEIATSTQTSVSLLGTKIRGDVCCTKQEVLRLYSEWFNSEIDRNKNLDRDVPLPWQGRKTLKIEKINFQNLNASASNGGAKIDINLLDSIIEV
ncbi:MAG: hypothetical protein AABW51_01610 [Nanoarchaeota archaeon]